MTRLLVSDGWKPPSDPYSLVATALIRLATDPATTVTHLGDCRFRYDHDPAANTEQ